MFVRLNGPCIYMAVFLDPSVDNELIIYFRTYSTLIMYQEMTFIVISEKTSLRHASISVDP